MSWAMVRDYPGFTPAINIDRSANAPHIHSGLDGAEIQTNSSGSHFEIRKVLLTYNVHIEFRLTKTYQIQTRVDLIKGATQLSKGIYLYANCIGCVSIQHSTCNIHWHLANRMGINSSEYNSISGNLTFNTFLSYDGGSMIIVNGK